MEPNPWIDPHAYSIERLQNKVKKADKKFNKRIKKMMKKLRNPENEDSK